MSLVTAAHCGVCCGLVIVRPGERYFPVVSQGLDVLDILGVTILETIVDTGNGVGGDALLIAGSRRLH